jgi:hypothetical protein
MEPGELRRRVADNPFYVLGLRPSCSRAEAEREGAKLLGMLELGLANATSYPTPLGLQPRTPEKVREAMAELREPARRLRHELWARAEPILPQPPDPLPGAEPPPAWEAALADLGWGPR